MEKFQEFEDIIKHVNEQTEELKKLKEKYAEMKSIYCYFRHISIKILKISPLYVIIIVATQSNRFLPLWENTLAKGVFSIYSCHNGGDCVATMRDYTFSVRSLVVGAHFFC